MEYDVPGRVLLTGGSGFIGSALLWELNRQGFDDVVVADVLDRSEKWKNLVALRFHDYLDAAELLARVESDPTFLGEFRLVVHLGACSSTTETDAAYLMRNNYAYTRTLAEAALASDVRFVYASSAATYGSLENDLTESRPLRELRPLNMYAYSKQLFDLHAERTGMLQRIAGLKYFNVYGPNEAHKGDMRSMVAKAFDQIATDGVVRLFRSYRREFADGEQRRDFLYVKDAVRMTLAVVADRSAHGIFNVGSGRSHTWLELAHAVYGALDLEPRIEFVEMPDSLRAKYQYHTQATTERLRRVGFGEHATSLRAGISDYVRRYLSSGARLDPDVREPLRTANENRPPAASRTDASRTA